MTKVTLPSGKYLIVDVIENQGNDIYIIRDQDDYDQYQLMYPSDNFNGLQNYTWVDLPKPGSYTLIGVDPLNLTEDEWKGVVEQHSCEFEGEFYSGYKDYEKHEVGSVGWKYDVADWPFERASSSGSSLLTANGHKQGSAVILKVND